MSYKKIKMNEIFGADTVDPELWEELDGLDDGERIHVPLTVADLKKIRFLIKKEIAPG